MDLSKINAAAKPGAGLLPLTKLQDLKHGLYYQVTNIYKAKTKFGDGVMVNLENTHAGFLPRRLNKFFEANPKDLEKLQDLARSDKLLIVNVGGDDESASYLQFAVSETPLPAEMSIDIKTGALLKE